MYYNYYFGYFQSKKAFERITVPKHFHPFITGANNEKLNQLSAETNTRINVPPSSVENEEITIAGEKEGVENAKNRILDIYREMVIKFILKLNLKTFGIFIHSALL